MAKDDFRTLLRRAAQSETTARRRPGRIGVLAGLSAFTGLLIALMLIPATALVAVTFNDVTNDVVDLPLTLEDQENAQTTRLLASDGKLIAYFYKENRQDVPLKEIAPVM